jgi:hypothetical protein
MSSGLGFGLGLGLIGGIAASAMGFLLHRLLPTAAEPISEKMWEVTAFPSATVGREVNMRRQEVVKLLQPLGSPFA